MSIRYPIGRMRNRLVLGLFVVMVCLLANPTPVYERHTEDGGNTEISSPMQTHMLSAGENWLTGWAYRQQHVMNKSDGADENYTVRIVVDGSAGSSSGDTCYLDGKMQLDFDDVRFTSSDGSTLLSYYDELKFDGGQQEYFYAESKSGEFYGNNIPSAYYDLNNERTYVTFFGSNYDAYVIYYDHQTDDWSNDYKAGTNPIGDDYHGAPVLWVNTTGHVHILFGAHENALQHRVTSNPNDISVWEDSTDIPSSEKVTYPHVSYDPIDNVVHVWYRSTIAGDSELDMHYTNSTDNGYTWNTYQKVVDTVATAAIYPQRSKIDPVDRDIIHLTWRVWNYTLARETGLHYAYLNVTTGELYNVSGSNLGTSISGTEIDDCKFQDVLTGQRKFGQSIHIFNDNLYVIFNNYSLADTNSTALFMFWNGTTSSWTTPEVIYTTPAYYAPDVDYFVYDETNISAFLLVGKNVTEFTWDGSTWTLDTWIRNSTTREIRNAVCPAYWNNTHDEEIRVLYCEWETNAIDVKAWAWGTSGNLNRTFDGYANYWVKIAGNLTDADQTIYVYYGNTSVTSIASGFDTFPEFFNNTSTSGWTTSNIDVTTSGDYLRFNNSVAANAGEAYRYDLSMPTDEYIVMMRMKTISLGTVDQMSMLFMDGSTSDRFAQSNNPRQQNQDQWWYWYGGVAYYGGGWSEGSDCIFEVHINESDSATGIDYYLRSLDRTLLSSVVDKQHALGTPTDLDGIYLGDASGAANVDAYYHFIAFRKYISSEPAHHTWGIEDTGVEPSNDAAPALSNPDDVDYMYAKYRVYEITSNCSDGSGFGDIDVVILMVSENTRTTNRWTVMFEEDSASFSVVNGSSIISMSGSTNVSSGNCLNITWRITIDWDHDDDTDLDAKQFVNDTAGNADTDWYEVDWNVETQLDYSIAPNVDDNLGTVDRGDIDGTFYTSGTVIYYGSGNDYPPTGEVDVWVSCADVVGSPWSDLTLSSGVFNVTTTADDIVNESTYTIKVVEESAGSGGTDLHYTTSATVTYISDLVMFHMTINDHRVNPDDVVTIWINATYAYDGTAFNSSGSITSDAPNAVSYVSGNLWSTTDTESSVMANTYNITGFTDAGHGITKMGKVHFDVAPRAYTDAGLTALDVTDISISAWVYFDDYNSDYLDAVKYTGTGISMGWEVCANPVMGGALIFYCEGHFITLKDFGSWGAMKERWIHFVITIEGTNFNSWVNGEHTQVDYTMSAGYQYYANGRIIIGDWWLSDPMRGYVDSISIYNRCLTEAEALGLYCRQPVIDSSLAFNVDPTTWCLKDEVWMDISGNGYNVSTLENYGTTIVPLEAATYPLGGKTRGIWDRLNFTAVPDVTTASSGTQVNFTLACEYEYDGSVCNTFTVHYRRWNSTAETWNYWYWFAYANASLFNDTGYAITYKYAITASDGTDTLYGLTVSSWIESQVTWGGIPIVLWSASSPDDPYDSDNVTLAALIGGDVFNIVNVWLQVITYPTGFTGDYFSATELQEDIWTYSFAFLISGYYAFKVIAHDGGTNSSLDENSLIVFYVREASSIAYDNAFLYTYNRGGDYVDWENFIFYVNGTEIPVNSFYNKTDATYNITITDIFGDTIYSQILNFSRSFRIELEIHSFMLVSELFEPIWIRLTSSGGGYKEVWLYREEPYEWWLYENVTYQWYWDIDQAGMGQPTGPHYYPTDGSWYTPTSALMYLMTGYGMAELKDDIPDSQGGGGGGLTDADKENITEAVIEDIKALFDPLQGGSVGIMIVGGFILLSYLTYTIPAKVAKPRKVKTREEHLEEQRRKQDEKRRTGKDKPKKLKSKLRSKKTRTD